MGLDYSRGNQTPTPFNNNKIKKIEKGKIKLLGDFPTPPPHLSAVLNF
jgi:hypothetical protein